MTALRLGVVFAAALLAGLFAFWPMKVGLESAGATRLGLGAATVEGTLWRGRLVDADFRGRPLGDVEVRLGLLALLRGETHLLLEREAGRLRAEIRRGRDGAEVRGLTADVPLGALGLSPPMQGSLRLTEVSARFADGRCESASGRATTDALLAVVEGWTGPSLSGQARCDGEALLLPLAGRADATEIRADLRVFADGRVRVDLRVRAHDPLLAAALTAGGFESGPDGLALSYQGAIV